MAKVKGQDALITREQYNSFKKMDRADAETFLRTIFDKGVLKGRQESSDNAVSEGVLRFVEMLKTAPGIGKVTYIKILAAFKEWESGRGFDDEG